MEVQFDPGFVKHMSAFVPNIQYVYETLAQFKNFNQKKVQFKMYLPKIQNLLKNYMGFYMGCILWAICIKQHQDAKIMNNLCYGGEYSEDETLSEVDFIKEYLEQLKKDVKYYTGQNFSADENYTKILDWYREFLKLNEGFVKTQTTDDIKLPSRLSVLPKNDLDAISQDIDKVVSNGNLYELLPYIDKVM